jgi:hypothetical protein
LLNILRFLGAIGRLFDFAHHVEAVAPPARSQASTGATSLSNVLVVHAHPESKSLTSALKDLAVETLTAQGHTVQVSDLYAANWKAVADRGDFLAQAQPDRLSYAAESRHAFATGTQSPDVEAEQQKLLWADAVLLSFPIWWLASVPMAAKDGATGTVRVP